LIGRVLPSRIVLLSNKNLWIGTLIRFAFYPVFLLLAKSILFKNDVWTFIFMALFAMSNGYLASLTMMGAPSYLEPNERERGGFLMTCFLVMGIFFGSHIALLFEYIKLT
jgi:hypothetical protein